MCVIRKKKLQLSSGIKVQHSSGFTFKMFNIPPLYIVQCCTSKATEFCFKIHLEMLSVPTYLPHLKATSINYQFPTSTAKIELDFTTTLHFVSDKNCHRLCHFCSIIVIDILSSTLPYSNMPKTHRQSMPNTHTLSCSSSTIYIMGENNTTFNTLISRATIFSY